MLLHNREELDDDLGGRADKHLALTLALGVDNAVKSVVLSLQSQSSGVRYIVSPKLHLVTSTELCETKGYVGKDTYENGNANHDGLCM